MIIPTPRNTICELIHYLQNQVVMYQKYSAETAKQNSISVKMVLECQKIEMCN